MYVFSSAKQDVLKILKAALGKSFSPSVADLSDPPSSDMGDVAFPCFALAKAMKKNPAELATEIAAKAAPAGLIAKVEARGPYVNAWMDTEKLGTRVLKEIATAKERYGCGTQGAGKRVLIEFANLNTHKEVHIGHVRNMALGQAVSNVLAAVGYDAIPHAYINDLGNNVAKCLWAYQKFHKDETPEKGEENEFFGRVYAEATQRLEGDEKATKEVSDIQRELESGKGEWVKLWKKTNKWSLDGLRIVFKDFGLSLKKILLESDLLSATKRTVKDLIARGIAVHSEGAWVVRLEDDGCGVSVLVKSDGTHLYNAKDIALAQKKEEVYHADRSIYVVDARQKLAMAQLFVTLRRMGFEKELVHLSYGQVSLPEGAMSSRQGNIVRYRDVEAQALALAVEETKKRHTDWKDKRIDKVAWAITFAALKYSMLRVDPEKPVIFDVKEALAFDGMSGPYLLYVIARGKTLLGKTKEAYALSAHGLGQPEEKVLLRELALYPEVVAQAASDLMVSRLAQFLFTLAQSFSRFYAEVPVLAEENVRVRTERLALVSAVVQTLENGVRMLGMDALDEM